MSLRFTAWRCAASPVSRVRATIQHGLKSRSVLRAVSTSSVDSSEVSPLSNLRDETKPAEQQNGEVLSAAEIARDKVLTGSAKLMAEALVEEETTKATDRWRERSEKEASDIP